MPYRCPAGWSLCCEALMVEYPGFKWNEKRSIGVDVAPGLAMEKEIRRESLGEGDCSDGKFDEAGRPVNSGAEFSSPEMAYAEAKATLRGAAPSAVTRFMANGQFSER